MFEVAPRALLSCPEFAEVNVQEIFWGFKQIDSPPVLKVPDFGDAAW